MNIQQLFPSIFAIVIGCGMLGLWSLLFIQKQIPELQTEPVRIGFHIAAETITALLLLFSGVAILLGWRLASWLYPLAIGMLIYTAIISPGYYAQKDQWAFVWMFAAIILLAVISLLLFL